MSVTIIEFPQNIWVLSKETIRLKAKCNSFVTSSGSAFTTELAISTDASDGDELIIGGSWWTANVGADETFTFKNVVVDTHDIGTKGPAELTHWIDTRVIPVLNASWRFSQHFVASRLGNHIMITALNVGADIAIDVTYSGFGGTITPTAGVDMGLNENIRLRLRVCANTEWRGSSFQKSAWLYFSPKLVIESGDYIGLVDEDLSEVVNAMMMPIENILPSAYLGDATAIDSRKIYLELVEHDDAAEFPFEADVMATRPFFAHKGGRRIIDTNTTFRSQYISGSQYLLSPLAKQQYVGAGHWGVVSFHLRGDTMRIRTYGWDTDDADADLDIAIDTTVLGDFLKVFDVSEYLTGDYRRVDVLLLVGAGEQLLRTYYMMESTNQGFTLAYINAFGFVDSIWCEGLRNYSVAHSRQSMRIERTSAANYATTRMKSYGRVNRPGLQATTAAMSQREWMGAAEFLLSRSLWYGKPNEDGTRQWIPCELSADNIENASISMDGNQLSTIPFKLLFDDEIGWSTNNGGMI